MCVAIEKTVIGWSELPFFSGSLPTRPINWTVFKAKQFVSVAIASDNFYLLFSILAGSVVDAEYVFLRIM